MKEHIDKFIDKNVSVSPIGEVRFVTRTDLKNLLVTFCDYVQQQKPEIIKFIDKFIEGRSNEHKNKEVQDKLDLIFINQNNHEINLMNEAVKHIEISIGIDDRQFLEIVLKEMKAMGWYFHTTYPKSNVEYGRWASVYNVEKEFPKSIEYTFESYWTKHNERMSMEVFDKELKEVASRFLTKIGVINNESD